MGNSRTPGIVSRGGSDFDGSTLSRAVAFLGPTDAGDGEFWDLVDDALAAVRLIPPNSCMDLDPITKPIREYLLSADRPETSSEELQELYSLLVVQVAEQYLSVREGKADNSGTEVEMFQQSAGGTRGNAWCAAFVYHCHAEAASRLGGYTTCPRDMRASFLWYKSKGLNDRYTVAEVRAGTVDPQPGDVFVFEELIATPKTIKKAYEKAVEAAKAKYADALGKAAGDTPTVPGSKPGAPEAVGAKDKLQLALREAETRRDAMTKRLHQGAVIGTNLAKDQPVFFKSHAGLIKSFDPAIPRMITVEGNTSDGEVGSREGDGVYERHDRLDVHFKTRWPKYPQLYGFVRPRFTYS